MALALGRTCIKISLGTKDPGPARYLAAQLDATAAHLFMSADTSAITKEQLADLFRTAFERHRAKLALIADFERQEAAFDPRVEMAEELAMGWAYRIIARKGPGARVDDDDSQTLATFGFDADDITKVGQRFAEMQRSGEATPSKAKICHLVEEVGAEPTPGNIARAQPIYVRALSEALLPTTERYQTDPLPLKRIVDAVRAEADAESVPTAAHPVPAPSAGLSPKTLEGGGAEIRPSIPQLEIDDRVETVGAKLVERNRQDKTWDAKTCRQAEMIFDLFGRFVREELKMSGLSQVRQEHLDELTGSYASCSSPTGRAHRTAPAPFGNSGGSALKSRSGNEAWKAARATDI